MKPRLFVLTDITSIHADVLEPDDAQSLVRLLHYANEIDIEGLCATSGLHNGQVCRPENVLEILCAYERDFAGLSRHADFPSPDALRQLVRAGQPVAGPDVPVEQSIGDGKETAASRLLVARALADDPRPLYVAVWGGTADVAQALWTLQRTHPPQDLETFFRNVRLHVICEQDSTLAYLRETYPRLFLIICRYSNRGIYRGGDTTYSGADWVATHVNACGSALGRLYPNYRGGDIWSRQYGPVLGVKEGDTASFLNLIDNGLVDVNDPDWTPEWGGWGGWAGNEANADRSLNRNRPYESATPRLWDGDDLRHDGGDKADLHKSLFSVYRHRPAFQRDFARRLSWVTTPPEAAPKPPVVNVQGGLRHSAGEQSAVRLNITADQPVTWHWWTDIDRAGGTLEGDWPDVTFHKHTDSVHLVLSATAENGLTGYARVRFDRRHTV